MAHAVTLSFADPDAETVETDDGLWAFSGVRTDEIRRIVVNSDGWSDALDALTRETEDAVVVRVSPTRRRGTVDAFRSVTGTRDLYYLRSSDGTTLLTDHFRTALAGLEVAERRVAEETIADHLLFRAPIEPRSYVTRVRSVGQGEWVHWDGTENEWNRTLVDTLSTSSRADPDHATGEIDATLAGVLEAGADDSANVMFSGGVDSTLLYTYLDDPLPFVMEVDSPEFAFERDYASGTLSLLDARESERVTLAEDDFLAHLEASVDALGFPSHYNQTVVTDAAFRRAPSGQYVNGESADALFGLPGTKGSRVADWVSPLLRQEVADALESRLPGRTSSLYRGLTTHARRLDRPTAAPRSFPNQFAFFTDPGVVGDFLSASLVRDRFDEQAAYVRHRVPLTDRGGYPSQIEFGHLLSYLRHNTVDQWRQLGYVHGQRILSPFTTRSMARCVLSIPAERRYVQGLESVGGLETKYHLKDLLAERLPEYDVDRPKGSGSLPVERYFEDGPLSDAFERYAPPRFVPESAYDEHVHSFGPVTWNLLTYAVWRDRVLHNPDLEPVTPSQKRHVRVPIAPPVPGS